MLRLHGFRIGEFAVDSDEYDMDADPSGRVSGV